MQPETYPRLSQIVIQSKLTRQGWKAASIDPNRSTAFGILPLLSKVRIPASELQHPEELAELVAALAALWLVTRPQPCQSAAILDGLDSCRCHIAASAVSAHDSRPDSAALLVQFSPDVPGQTARARWSALLSALQTFPPATATAVDRYEAVRAINAELHRAIRCLPQRVQRDLSKRIGDPLADAVLAAADAAGI